LNNMENTVLRSEDDAFPMATRRNKRYEHLLYSKRTCPPPKHSHYCECFIFYQTRDLKPTDSVSLPTIRTVFVHIFLC
ncbi:MAG: hypothetical protein PUD24_06890, partial [Oscillospiraceae bacterium]|nr:hypothetical protein [Oscillospiraceae bacterium]